MNLLFTHKKKFRSIFMSIFFRSIKFGLNVFKSSAHIKFEKRHSKFSTARKHLKALISKSFDSFFCYKIERID